MSRITERRIYAIPSTPFTSNGTNTGQLQVADNSDWIVGQIIYLTSNTQENLELKIKRILPDKITMFVGPKDKNIHVRTDISDFILADNAAIQANEQERPNIPEQEVERITYEEEPTIARRTILVDKWGCRYDDTNPLPVDATVTVGGVDVNLTHKDDYPNIGDKNDSVRIGDGNNELQITNKLEGRVVDTLHCGGLSTIVNIADTPIAIKVGGTAKADRKTIFAKPLAKGLVWGFNSDVEISTGPKGGCPMGKNQPHEWTVEANTIIYIIGPATGVNIFVAEA